MSGEGSSHPRFVAGPTVQLRRPGVAKTLLFYSFSGAILVEGPLRGLAFHLDEDLVEIDPPMRIGEPSRRASPQFTQQSFGTLFRSHAPIDFPLQAAAFAGLGTDGGASVNFWEGPGGAVSEAGPPLPADTLAITVHGPNGAERATVIEREILPPLLEWLRVLTDQWWIGRSYEGITGPLHLAVPLDSHGRTIGKPTPVVRLTTALPQMRPVTDELWIKAAQNCCDQVLPPADASLAADALYSFFAREFRVGVILAASALEAARDQKLSALGVRLAQLACPPRALPRHLSDGFGRRLGRNLADEDPHLFAFVTALWDARGQAAHGKPVVWRIGDSEMLIDELDTSVFAYGLSAARSWISRVDKVDGSKG